jgi:protein TonB
MMVALLAGLGLFGAGSCTREQPAREAPMIPVDVMPKLLASAVKYPEEARDKGLEGLVRVKAFVGKDGKVIEAAVDAGQSGPPVLEKAAVDAVRQWTFEPARAKGEPVEIWIVVPVNFRLH